MSTTAGGRSGDRRGASVGPARVRFAQWFPPAPQAIMWHSNLKGAEVEPIEMQFIELSGKQLLNIVEPDELPPAELAAAGVSPDSLVRVNRQGDIELRKRSGWEIIGGLLGDFDHRLRQETGLDWA
ncbi:MAG: hypothetical protein AB7O68_23915 [Pirellulales bacterium]